MARSFRGETLNRINSGRPSVYNLSSLPEALNRIHFFHLPFDPECTSLPPFV